MAMSRALPFYDKCLDYPNIMTSTRFEIPFLVLRLVSVLIFVLERTSVFVLFMGFVYVSLRVMYF